MYANNPFVCEPCFPPPGPQPTFYPNNPFVPEPHGLNSSVDSSEHSYNRHPSGSESNEPYRKMFVGGLHWSTTVESLRSYFENFGLVEECVIMRDAKTKLTRGFGFVTFADAVDIQKIDPQIAIRHISPARSVNNICRKVFIGGVAQNCDVEEIKHYFSRFGQVEDAVLKMDYPKKQHRGFGFITFVQSETADLVCHIRYHEIHGKPVECKKAQKKEFVKYNTEATLAASHLLANLPQDQVLAIYNMFTQNQMNMANNNVHPMAYRDPIPSPAPSTSTDEFVDPYTAEFHQRLFNRYY
ncbi:RNA-binding protein Musashi-like protein 2 [Aphelenchoides fujianensis]|nr:RNA-binding protein Musashi-like protein 2 [Aphelenchoides fujianensis]